MILSCTTKKGTQSNTFLVLQNGVWGKGEIGYASAIIQQVSMYFTRLRQLMGQMSRSFATSWELCICGAIQV